MVINPPQSPCPGCGAKLTVIDVSRRPDTPPYQCANCNRGWWLAELAATLHWDPLQRDFGPASTDIAAAADAEVGASIEAAAIAEATPATTAAPAVDLP